MTSASPRIRCYSSESREIHLVEALIILATGVTIRPLGLASPALEYRGELLNEVARTEAERDLALASAGTLGQLRRQARAVRVLPAQEDRLTGRQRAAALHEDGAFGRVEERGIQRRAHRERVVQRHRIHPVEVVVRAEIELQ